MTRSRETRHSTLEADGVQPVHYNIIRDWLAVFIFLITRGGRKRDEEIIDNWLLTLSATNLPPCEPQDVTRWQLQDIPGSMTSPPALASSTKHRLVTAEIPLVSRVGVAVHAWRRMNSNGRCPRILDTLDIRV